MNEPEEFSQARRWAILITLGLVEMILGAQVGMIAVALPTLAAEFQVDLPAVTWVLLAFFAGVASLQLTMGRLGDVAGRKRVYVAGVGVLLLGSLAAVGSPALWWLIVARLVQAVGASMVSANSIAILMHAWPAEMRGRAIGYFFLLPSSGFALSPLVGGIILELWSWQLIFVVMAVWSALAVTPVVFVLPSISPLRGERLDRRSAVYLVLWVGPVLFALNRGLDAGLASPLLLAPLALFTVFGWLFIRRQRSAADPLVEPSLFAIFRFRQGIYIGFLAGFAYGSVLLLAPFLLQNVLLIPVVQVGLIITATSAIIGPAAPLIGGLSDRFGPRVLRMVGLATMAFGLATLALTMPGIPVAIPLVGLLMVPSGGVLASIPNNSEIMGSAPRERLGIAGAFVQSVWVFGSASGGALWGSVFAGVVLAGSIVQNELDASADEQAIGFRIVFLLASGLALATALLSARRGPA